MLKGTIKSLISAAILVTGAVSVQAADFTIRATANSNENDEDYDGLVVFKNFVESASNGAIEVELFIGTQLCSKGAECLQGVADGSIEMGHARALLSLSASDQVMVCQKVISNNLSVRDVEALIGQRSPAKRKIKKQKTADIVNFEENLSDKLGTSVKISHKSNGSGVLKINYSNLDQLDSILKKIE